MNYPGDPASILMLSILLFCLLPFLGFAIAAGFVGRLLGLLIASLILSFPTALVIIMGISQSLNSPHQSIGSEHALGAGVYVLSIIFGTFMGRLKNRQMVPTRLIYIAMLIYVPSAAALHLFALQYQ